MTVIAWDGQTLAADRLMLINNQRVTVCKILRFNPNTLLAFGGTARYAGAFVHWLNSGAAPDAYPPMPGDDYMTTMMISRAEPTVTDPRLFRIDRYEAGPFPIGIFDDVFAIGSGCDFARAAMHLGRSARDAVLVASCYDATCGNGVDVLTL